MKKTLGCGCEIVDKSAAVSAKITLWDGNGKPYEIKIFYCTTGKHKGFSPINRFDSDGLSYFLTNEGLNYIRSRIRESGYDPA